MILLAYRHGLRASELVDLRWEQVDFKSASLAMRRLKNGTPSTHPLTGRELRELRRHQRESPQSPFVFVSERGAPLSRLGFAQWSSGLRQRPNSRSRRMRTCCATPAGSNSPRPASTPGRSKPISGTATSSTQSVIRSSRPIGSRIFGGIDLRGVGATQNGPPISQGGFEAVLFEAQRSCEDFGLHSRMQRGR